MSSSLYSVLSGGVLVFVVLVLLATLIFLIVRRRPLAAAGVGLVLAQHVLIIVSNLGAAWIVQSRDMDEFFAIHFGAQVVGNILFLVGLGLIVAEIFVKRPAGGFQGQP